MSDDENHFFRYIWRFNALAIACASTGVILLGCYAALTILKDETRVRRVTNVVNVGEGEKVLEEFSLGRPDIIAGTPYVRVPLRRGQTYGGGSFYYSKNTEQVVNYVFLNTSTSESRWLFEHASQLIVDSRIVYSQLKNLPDESRQSVGLLYVVVDRDTNSDGRLSEKDSASLVASGIDGTNNRTLIEGIEQPYSIQQIADDKLLVLYQKNAQTISELYSVPSLQRLKQATIPKVGLK